MPLPTKSSLSTLDTVDLGSPFCWVETKAIINTTALDTVSLGAPFVATSGAVIYYVDLENGNDANDGTTFALRKKTIGSAITGPPALADGDTVRVMATPAPTSLGNGKWTDGPLEARVTGITSTNATPIVVTQTAHGYSTGDVVHIDSHNTNTKANGFWKITYVSADSYSLDGSVGNGAGTGGGARRVNNGVVVLTTAPVKNIATCDIAFENNWTASANVTCLQANATQRGGYGCQNINIAAGFTTGKAAYYALPATTDFSGYQQVTFWIKQTSGTVAVAGDYSLRLCSDAAGAVTVNTIAIPGLVKTNDWQAIVVDNAAALGNSIASIAFYVDTDRGAAVFNIDQIYAAKAKSDDASLTLASLIGKNTAGETWYSIASIEKENIVLLDQEVNREMWGTTIGRGYSGTTETVTTYKREPAIGGPRASSSDSLFFAPNNGANSTYYKTIIGGWNRTDMSTRTDDTWISGVNGAGRLVSTSGNYNWYERLNAVRFNSPYNTKLVGSRYKNIACNNCSTGMSTPSFSAWGCEFDNITTNNNQLIGMAVTGSSSNPKRITTLVSNNNYQYGLDVSSTGGGLVIESATLKNNLSGELRITSSQLTIENLVMKGNAARAIDGLPTGSITVLGGSSSGHASSINPGITDCYFKNFTFGDTAVLNTQAYYQSGFIYAHNYNGTANDHRVYLTDSSATMQSEASVRHTASGIAWKVNVLFAERDVDFPVRIPIARFACAANALVTVKAWLRRTNTGLTLGILVPAKVLSGVNSDVITTMTAAADTWEEVTLTFTPTEAGATDLFLYAYGGTTYSGYIDDLTISQA